MVIPDQHFSTRNRLLLLNMCVMNTVKQKSRQGEDRKKRTMRVSEEVTAEGPQETLMGTSKVGTGKS